MPESHPIYYVGADALDYVEITSFNNPLMIFTSDPSTHRQCFNVTIKDDEDIESNEDFFLNLTLAGNPTVPVIVNPDTSMVEIIDTDGNLAFNTRSLLMDNNSYYSAVHVGFEKNFTSVYEAAGQFELCVHVFTETQYLPKKFNFSLDLVSVVDTAGMTMVSRQCHASSHSLICFLS